jgi:hypothetical protein
MPNISSGKSPQVWWDNGLPIQNDGIENLSLDHSNTGAAAGTFVLNGYNIWLKNIRDIKSDNKHVWLYQTTHVTVRDSYFYAAMHATSESYGIDSFLSADNLVENNIFQHMAFPMMNEGCMGCVQGYNYAVDDYYTGTPQGSSPEWQQASSYQHSVGDAFVLWEGNQGIGMTSDDVHGTSNFGTAFRNYWIGRDTAGGGVKTSQTNAVILNAFNRYYNIIGNVLGTPGYHNAYSTNAPNNSANCNSSIYALGWGGNCGNGSVPNDTLVASTLMRWGNYDTVNAANRFISGEVPSGISPFPNPVPANNNLPASFYLPAEPTWWGTVSWPPIGPDVTGGTGPGGHAYLIPAAACYLNVMGGKTDGSSGVLTFNADTCYSGADGVQAPTGLVAVPH